MTQEHFLDLMEATNFIPGPNSTEMTMHCDHERAGKPGLFVFSKWKLNVMWLILGGAILGYLLLLL